jgi:hypothetical protein
MELFLYSDSASSFNTLHACEQMAVGEQPNCRNISSAFSTHKITQL